MNDEITNGWESGKRIESEDFTLWDKRTDGSYYYYKPDVMLSWTISQHEDGLWWWIEVNHDGWDGSQLIDEIMDGSDQGVSSWKEAARWIAEHKELL